MLKKTNKRQRIKDNKIKNRGDDLKIILSVAIYGIGSDIDKIIIGYLDNFVTHIFNDNKISQEAILWNNSYYNLLDEDDCKLVFSMVPKELKYNLDDFYKFISGSTIQALEWFNELSETVKINITNHYINRKGVKMPELDIVGGWIELFHDIILNVSDIIKITDESIVQQIIEINKSNYNIRLIELTLALNVSVNSIIIECDNPMYLAIIKDDIKVIKLLIKHNIDIDNKIIHGYNSLHIAIIYGNLNIIELLIKNNVDINSKDIEGYTPLHLAIKKSNLKVVKLLIKNNASITQTNSRGETPLNFAIYKNEHDIIRFLIGN